MFNMKITGRHAIVLAILAVFFMIFLALVVNFDMHGGSRNSSFFLVTCPLTVLFGIAFCVMAFDPWDNFKKNK
jgi:hypothetical protein